MRNLTILVAMTMALLSSCVLDREGKPDPPVPIELIEIEFYGVNAEDCGEMGYNVEVPADSCTFEFSIPESYDEFSPYLSHGYTYTLGQTEVPATVEKNSITWDWGSVTQAEDANGRPIYNVRIAENTTGESRTLQIAVSGYRHMEGVKVTQTPY